MKEKYNGSKLRQLDKLIVKAKRKLNPVIAEVNLPTAEMDRHELSELEKKAREEILKDAVSGVRRYEKIGPQGWKRPNCLRTNKEFLERILRSTGPKPSTTNE
ncbi:hypothetical protein LOAG_02373 [Loa loa]|uniref:Uncharacterized protein n=1 Tax=Loa loa TaxID=7209 RepID=A0A1I7VHB9_LOALO|nr:hypothetical protein LOAG_02373 [Loa loa]EFO26105.1 hypothetical protein LOAG_02373 [Loa loa]